MPSPIPGGQTIRTAYSRQFLWSDKFSLEVGVQIDSTNAYDGANTGYERELRPGWLMAKITSSGKWVPCKRTQANGAGSTATALIVDNAAAFKAGDTLQIGSTTGTISSIDYGTNTITLTATKSWSDNDVVYATNVAGAEIARGILTGVDAVDLYDVEARTYRDMEANILVAGCVRATKLLGDAAAIRAVTNKLSHFVFDDDQGVG